MALDTLELGGTRYRFADPTDKHVEQLLSRLRATGARRPLLSEFISAAREGLDALTQKAIHPGTGGVQLGVEHLACAEVAFADMEADAAHEDPTEREFDYTRFRQLIATTPGLALIHEALMRESPAWSEIFSAHRFHDALMHVMTVRLLLREIDGVAIFPDSDGLLPVERYLEIPSDHLGAMFHFAFARLVDLT